MVALRAGGHPQSQEAFPFSFGPVVCQDVPPVFPIFTLANRHNRCETSLDPQDFNDPPLKATRQRGEFWNKK
jgi:hypothetical protein